MIVVIRRCLPTVEQTVISGPTYNVFELGNACAHRDMRLPALLRMDTAWSTSAPLRLPGTNGRPRLKGERLPQLGQVGGEQRTI